MEMQLTDREDFLISMTVYLLYSGDLPSEEKYMRSEAEIRAILNNSHEFINIDVLKDELSYFGLDRNNFKWTNEVHVWGI